MEALYNHLITWLDNGSLKYCLVCNELMMVAPQLREMIVSFLVMKSVWGYSSDAKAAVSEVGS